MRRDISGGSRPIDGSVGTADRRRDARDHPRAPNLPRGQHPDTARRGRAQSSSCRSPALPRRERVSAAPSEIRASPRGNDGSEPKTMPRSSPAQTRRATTNSPALSLAPSIRVEIPGAGLQSSSMRARRQRLEVPPTVSMTSQLQRSHVPAPQGWKGRSRGSASITSPLHAAVSVTGSRAWTGPTGTRRAGPEAGVGRVPPAWSTSVQDRAPMRWGAMCSTVRSGPTHGRRSDGPTLPSRQG